MSDDTAQPIDPDTRELLGQCEWMNAEECNVEEEVLPAEVDDVVPPGVALIQVAVMDTLTYEWTDGRRYRHKFEDAALYVTQHGGRGLCLLIGDFFLSDRGFIDGKPEEEGGPEG